MSFFQCHFLQYNVHVHRDVGLDQSRPFLQDPDAPQQVWPKSDLQQSDISLYVGHTVWMHRPSQYPLNQQIRGQHDDNHHLHGAQRTGRTAVPYAGCHFSQRFLLARQCDHCGLLHLHRKQGHPVISQLRQHQQPGKAESQTAGFPGYRCVFCGVRAVPHRQDPVHFHASQQQQLLHRLLLRGEQVHQGDQPLARHHEHLHGPAHLRLPVSRVQGEAHVHDEQWFHLM